MNRKQEFAIPSAHMLLRQGFKYALRLRKGDEAALRRWVGCRRFVYNEALAHQRAQVAVGCKRPGYASLCARLPELKRQYPWLSEPPAQALQQALKDLCKAWNGYDSKRLGAPRFASRAKRSTLRLPQDCRYDAHAGRLFLPKFGAVRLRHSRIAEGALKNVTLRQEGRRWFASLQTEREIEDPLPVSLAAVGLDFGATTSIMPSAGEPIRLPGRIGRYERRISRMQRAVSRKKKGGSNRRKAIARLAECHRRVSAIRRDFLHKETTKLANGHGLVAIEDLDVKRMTASASGTVDAPGKSVRQKAGLNRAILRNGWSMTRGMLEYKTARRGSALVAVSPAYTSQACNACGCVAAENRRTQALFSCIVCGYTDHADRNAAKNILRRAEELLGGRPATTAGWAGRYACEADPSRRPRPCSVAQGIPLAAHLISCQQVRWQEPDRGESLRRSQPIWVERTSTERTVFKQ